MKNISIRLFVFILLLANSSLAASEEERLKIAAEQLEATLVAQYLNSMQDGIKTDSMFGGGSAEQIYREMLNQEYAKYIKLGLTDEIYQKLLKKIVKKRKQEKVRN